MTTSDSALNALSVSLAAADSPLAASLAEAAEIMGPATRDRPVVAAVDLTAQAQAKLASGSAASATEYAAVAVEQVNSDSRFWDATTHLATAWDQEDTRVVVEAARDAEAVLAVEELALSEAGMTNAAIQMALSAATEVGFDESSTIDAVTKRDTAVDLEADLKTEGKGLNVVRIAQVVWLVSGAGLLLANVVVFAKMVIANPVAAIPSGAAATVSFGYGNSLMKRALDCGA
ncbi:MAG: hypothetical protein GY788_17275 [bacterium]|nr:hypothetical protein [bacterium]